MQRTNLVNLLSGPAHVDARGRSVGPLGDGKVNSDPAAVYFLCKIRGFDKLEEK